MDPEVTVQYRVSRRSVPAPASFRAWIMAALGGHRDGGEVVVRIVDEDESAQLNQAYRYKAGPTNVLSFPYEGPAVPGHALVGDLVICAPVVMREALEQGKSARTHWAHMTIHGVLHLLGYDHQTDAEALQMEALERDVMAGLGFPDPYEDEAEKSVADSRHP